MGKKPYIFVHINAAELVVGPDTLYMAPVTWILFLTIFAISQRFAIVSQSNEDAENSFQDYK